MELSEITSPLTFLCLRLVLGRLFCISRIYYVLGNLYHFFSCLLGAVRLPNALLCLEEL